MEDHLRKQSEADQDQQRQEKQEGATHGCPHILALQGINNDLPLVP